MGYTTYQLVQDFFSINSALFEIQNTSNKKTVKQLLPRFVVCKEEKT